MSNVPIEKSKIRTNLEMNTVTLTDVANDTTGDMTDTKKNFDSSKGIENDASQSLSDQSQGQMSNTQNILLSKISRETSFDSTTSESPNASTNSLCMALETDHGIHPGGVERNEVEDAGLEPISIAVSSESIKPTDSKGNDNINSLHLNNNEMIYN